MRGFYSMHHAAFISARTESLRDELASAKVVLNCQGRKPAGSKLKTLKSQSD